MILPAFVYGIMGARHKRILVFVRFFLVCFGRVATWFDSIQRTASGRVLNSTKANPREVPKRESVCGSTTPEKTARTSLLLLFLFHKAFLSITSSQHENVIEFSVTLPLKSAKPTLNSLKMHRNVTCVSPYPYLFSG